MQQKLKLPELPDGFTHREVGTAVEIGDRVPYAKRNPVTQEIFLTGWAPATAIGHRVEKGEVYIRKTRAAKRQGTALPKLNAMPV